jgi:predicted secreted protein
MRFVQTTAASLATTVAFVVVLSSLAIAMAVWFFGLSVAGGIALYFVVWWIVLFAVLPFGIRSQGEGGEVAHGTDPGAPSVPALREKSIWTTVWAAIVLLAVSGLLPLAGL